MICFEGLQASLGEHPVFTQPCLKLSATSGDGRLPLFYSRSDQSGLVKASKTSMAWVLRQWTNLSAGE